MEGAGLPLGVRPAYHVRARRGRGAPRPAPVHTRRPAASCAQQLCSGQSTIDESAINA